MIKISFLILVVAISQATAQNCTNFTLPATIPLFYTPDFCEAGLCQCNDSNQTWFYDNLCEFDCQCNHGLQVGTCNYTSQQCICSGEPAPNYFTACSQNKLAINFYIDIMYQAFKENRNVNTTMNSLIYLVTTSVYDILYIVTHWPFGV